MRETKPLEAAAIVLAGGKSSRMGQDKRWIPRGQRLPPDYADSIHLR